MDVQAGWVVVKVSVSILTSLLVKPLCQSLILGFSIFSRPWTSQDKVVINESMNCFSHIGLFFFL